MGATRSSNDYIIKIVFRVRESDCRGVRPPDSDRSHLVKATKLNKLEGLQGFAPCKIHLAAEDIRQDYLGLMTNKNSWVTEQINER